MKKWTPFVVWSMLIGLVGANEYPPVRFSGVLINSVQRPPVLLTGEFNTIVDLSTLGANDVPSKKWGFQKSVVFKNGAFELILPSIDSIEITPESPGSVLPADGYQFDYDNDGVLNTPSLYILAGGASEIFKLRSYPYSVRAQLTDLAYSIGVNSIDFSAGGLTSVNVSNTLRLNIANVLINSRNVQIGSFIVNPSHRLDVAGYMNASGYLLKGVTLSETLPWQSSLPTIKTSKKIGIGLVYPQSDLDVGGTINASQLYLNGNQLEFKNEWINPIENGVVDTSSPIGLSDSYNVGVGIFRPVERLELDGAMRVSADLIRDHPTGSIQFGLLRNPVLSTQFNQDFQGLVASGNTKEWRSLLGYSRDVRVQRVAFFMSQPALGASHFPRPKVGSTGLDFATNTGRVGIGLLSNAMLALKPLSSQLDIPIMSVKHANGDTVYPVLTITGTGNVGIGTSQPEYALDIQGIINMQDLYKEGVPYRLGLSRGTYFQLNANNDIFYMYGNVGIGRPDPRSRLEISAPNVEKGDIPPNPAITISHKSGSELVSYTLGVDRMSQDVFRVEYGRSIGSSSPLFVAQKDRFGVGTDVPYANLTVVGTGGLLITGGFPNGAVLEPIEENAIFLWYPRKNVWRMGGGAIPMVDADMGLFSTAIGQDNIAKGNYSMILGGKLNRVEGAYSTTLGGTNLSILDTSDFSLGMGMGLAIQHHGVFGWGDRSIGVVTRSQKENQLLIRASGGVGIGTNQTSISPSYDDPLSRMVSLAISGVTVTPYMFLDRQAPIFLVDPTQNAVTLFQTLMADGYLNSRGQLEMFNRADATLTNSGIYSSYPAIKTVLNELYDRPIVTLSNSRASLLTILNSESVLVGYPSGDVKGLMMRGPMVAGVTDSGGIPTASIHMILSSSTSALPLSNFAMAIMTQKTGGVSYNLVLDERGNLGIHRIPTFKPFNAPENNPRNPENRAYYLDVAGSLAVSGNMSWWNGKVLVSGSYAADPWMKTLKPFPAPASVQLVFPSGNPILINGQMVLPTNGNVGIGTASPNYLLTLSNRSSYSNLLTPVRWPELTFDENGTDYYTVGRRSVPNTLFIYSGGSAIDENNLLNSSLVIQPNRIGLFTIPANGTVLDILGTWVVSPKQLPNMVAVWVGIPQNKMGIMSVTTANISSLFVGDTMVDWYRGNRSNSIFREANIGTPQDPLYTYVGIGTSDPQYEIDVQGILRASNIVAQSATFNNLTLSSQPLSFLEESSVMGRLSFANDRLILQAGGGDNLVLSDIMTAGESLRGGELALITPTNIFSKSNMYWKPDAIGLVNQISAGTWSVTGSIALNFGDTNISWNYMAISSINPSIGVSKMSSLQRGALLSSSYPYTLENMTLGLIPQFSGDLPSNSQLYNTAVTGMALTITSNVASTLLSTGVKLVGLNVDLTKASRQMEGVRGEKIAAIFMGNVGIATTKPDATLDINGSVVADRFIISSGLTIVSINIGSNILDVGINRGVGIGGIPTLHELEIKDTAQMRDLTAKVIETPMIQVNQAVFNVTNTKKVGIGLMEPEGLLHTKHTLGSLSDQSGFSVNTTIPEIGDDGRPIPYAMELNSVTVKVSSAPDRSGYSSGPVNILGQRIAGNTTPIAYGTYIDATTLRLEGNPNFPDQKPSYTGVMVQMPNHVRSYPAVFINDTMPTRVGIGMTNPVYALDINGVMQVNNLDLTLLPNFNFEVIRARTVNILSTATINGLVSANQLMAAVANLSQVRVLTPWNMSSRGITVNVASIDALNAVGMTTYELRGETATLTAQHSVIQKITSMNHQYLYDELPPIRQPNALLSRVDVLNALTTNTLDIPNRLIVKNSQVGVGVEPASVLHIASTQTVTMNVASHNSWASMIVHRSPQNDVWAGSIGLAFLFDSGEIAGIQSQRGSAVNTAENSDHNLVFLVQSEAGNSLTPAMTIFKDGRVGIGVEEWPDSLEALLYVSGNVKSHVLKSNTLYAKAIVSASNNSLFYMPTHFPKTQFDAEIRTSRVDLKPYNSELPHTPGYTHLLTRDNQLIMNRNEQNFNFGDQIPRSANTLLWYDRITGLLTNTTVGAIFVANGGLSITINARQEKSGVQLVGAMNQDPVSTMMRLRGSMPQRNVLESAVTLNGLSIQASTGVLNAAAQYTGLNINLRNLPIESYLGLQLQKGVKTAAQFWAGSDATNGWLLSNTLSNTNVVSASVRIIGDNEMMGGGMLLGDQSGLQLAIPSRAVLLVRPQGAVADIPNTLFGIYPNTSGSYINVAHSNGTMFILNANRMIIGVGTKPNRTAQVEVDGSLRTGGGMVATVVSTNSLYLGQPQALSITTPMDEVLAKVGMGGTQPSYQLDIQSSISGNAISLTAAPVAVQRITTQLNGSFNSKTDINALRIGLELENNPVQETQIVFSPSATAELLRIKMDRTELEPTAIATGLFVSIPSPNRAAALFLGGEVGIGVMVPTERLDLAGVMRANTIQFQKQGYWDVSQTTVNSIEILTQANVPEINLQNQTVTINRLYVYDSETVTLPEATNTDMFQSERLLAKFTSANRVMLNINHQDVSQVGSTTLLYVSGNAQLSNRVTVEEPLSTTDWDIPNLMAIQSSVEFRANQQLHLYHLMTPLLQLNNDSGISPLSGQLRFNSSSLSLYKSGSWFELSRSKSIPNQLAYFNNSSTITANSGISYLSSPVRQLTLSVPLKFNTDITSNGVSVFRGFDLDAKFPLRNSSASNELIGMRLSMVSNEGGLYRSDTVVGLLVSINPTLDDPFWLPDGTRIVSHGLAAYFNNAQTGNILINEGDVTRPAPLATLHIVPQLGSPWLMTSAMEDVVGVRVTSSIMTIGQPSQVASLGIARDGVQWGVYQTGSAPVEGATTYVRIATVNKTHELNTTGLKARTVNLTTQIVASELNVNQSNGSPLFWVTSSGFAGVGTRVPSAVFDLQRSWDDPQSELLEPTINMGMNGVIPNAGNITGIKIGFHPTGNIRWVPQSTIRGFVIDLSQLNSTDPTKVVGVKVQSKPNHFAAHILGHVGIGVEPTEKLSVLGGVTLNTLYTPLINNSGFVSLKIVTVNGSGTSNRNLVVLNTVNITETILVTNHITVTSIGNWYTQLALNENALPDGSTAQSIYIMEGGLSIGSALSGSETLKAPISKITQLVVTTINQLTTINGLAQLNAPKGVRVTANMTLDTFSMGRLTLPSLNPVSNPRTVYASSSGLQWVNQVGQSYSLMPTGNPYQLVTFDANYVTHKFGITWNMTAIQVNRSLHVNLPIQMGDTMPVVGSTVKVTLTDRPAPNYLNTTQNATMVGAFITGTATSSAAGNAADRLNGLVVSMNAVEDTSSTPLPLLIDQTQFSQKVAATFMAVRAGESGGSVGIIATDNTISISTINRTIDATLVMEVKADSSLSALRAKSNATHGIFVSPTGDVAIGASESNAAKLVLDSGELRVVGATPETVVTLLDSSRMGIGISNPVARLHIVGDDPLAIDDAEDGSMRLQVTANGRVSLGASNPHAMMTVLGDILVNQTNQVIKTHSQGQVSILSASSMGGTNRVGDLGVLGNLLIGGARDSISSPLTIASGNEWIGVDINNGGENVLNTSGGWTLGVSPNPLQYRSNWSIGTTQNTAVLSVGAQTGAVMALRGGGADILVVSSNGSIGLNTAPMSGYRLSVVGDVSMEALTVTSLSATTLGTLTQVSVTTTSIWGVAHDVRGELNTDFNQTLIGVSIQNQDSRASYTNAPTIRGVVVDVGGIETLDPLVANGPGKGQKIAAILTGGPVIIDAVNRASPESTFTSISGVPTSSLLVVANTGTNGIKLNSGSGGKIIALNRAGTNQQLLFDSGNALSVGLDVNIGFNTATPPTDVKVELNGDMRLGLESAEAILGVAEPGDGNQLVFSGGDKLTGATDSENTDTFSIARFNYKQGVSELRFRVDDSDTTNPNATFSINSGATHHLVIQRKGYADPNDIDKAKANFTDVSYRPAGHIGIGTSNPVAVFDVTGTVARSPAEDASHQYLVTIKNKDSVQAPLLALQNNGSNSTSTFIRFQSTASLKEGQFRMQALSPGVVFESDGADYAEYVPRGTIPPPVPGDVVSMDHGQTSFDTNGKGVLMVISERPIVVGNWQSDRVSMDMISFMGQVHIKIQGSVTAGDYLIPSGQHDGCAKVMGPNDPTHQIIGVALESTQPNATRVAALVGLPIRNRLMAQQLAELATHRQAANRIRDETRRMAALLGNRLDALEAQLGLGGGGYISK